MRSLFATALLLVGCDTGPRLFDTTRLGNTFDLVGPYRVQSAVAGTSAPDAVELAFTTPELPDELTRPMVEVASGVYEGEIPGQPAFTQVRYRVRLRDGDETRVDPQGSSGDERWFGFWVLGGSCAEASDCAPGEYCHVAGTCRASQGSCRVDEDCGGQRECGPGGRCRAPLRRCGGCTLGEACEPTSGACVPQPRCDEGLACPLDFMCERHAGVCRRVCAGPAECSRGESCSFGLCRAAE